MATIVNGLIQIIQSINMETYSLTTFLDIAVSNGLLGVIIVVAALIFSIKRVVKLQKGFLDNYVCSFFYSNYV